MKRFLRLSTLLILFVISIFSLGACQHAPSSEVLYVNITWHQHQPLYYKNEDGVYTRPWVRVHATKDYLDMAEKVALQEDIRVTFNLTPSLLRQLDDLAKGAKDLYWVLGETSVNDLSDADKRFILERFFDVNWVNIISRYPRYQHLLDKRGGGDPDSIDAAMKSFSDQDIMDLQVWFNLAWFDPVYLDQDPLNALVEKGKNFTAADKDILFTEVREVVQQVIPYHRTLQEKGQIEVTTTPYAHPILPLIYDNQLALVGNPTAEMPEQRFSFPQDAEKQLELGFAMYERFFGRPSQGLWPGEGGVAQAIVPMVAETGVQFMQTGEPVLAKSLGIESFTRNARDFVQEADELYRPYYVRDDAGNQVAVFFRDGSLSDKLGFVYRDMPGEVAANDLVSHLEAIHANFVENEVPGPHIVSIILDGENAWEHYENDANEFLNALYQKLSESKVLQTVTPSQYLSWFPEQRALDDLFPGAWFSPNYDTWIGETEEAIAWDYLAQVRQDLAEFETDIAEFDQDSLDLAFDYMYLAEGSDWFWWYGDDQDSGQDSYFDEGFRALLIGVYESLGQEAPQFLRVPIIQAPVIVPERPFSEISTPEIDGEPDLAWETAAYYPLSEDGPITGLHVTLDNENFYLRLDIKESLIEREVGFYIDSPGFDGASTAFAKESDLMLGFNANKLLAWKGGESLEVYHASDDGWDLLDITTGQVMMGDAVFEFSLPLQVLGEFSAGDALRLTMILGLEGDRYPVVGPIQLIMPDFGEIMLVLQVDDPVGDDYGPGTYIYPEDAVFKDLVFDADSFSVGYDDENLVLTFGFVGPVENPWGSPNSLALQTLDVYIDIDPNNGTGVRQLLPGRNAALVEGYGWEYAIWAEGWNPQVIQVDPETQMPVTYSEASSAMKIIVDTAKNEVVIRVPLQFFGESQPENWAYSAVVLSQEGYPSQGVWRVRDVAPDPAQYLLGGGPGDVNHTRIIDLILPNEALRNQTNWLSDYPSTQEAIDTLTPDDFPQIPMIEPNN